MYSRSDSTSLLLSKTIIVLANTSHRCHSIASASPRPALMRCATHESSERRAPRGPQSLLPNPVPQSPIKEPCRQLFSWQIMPRFIQLDHRITQLAPSLLIFLRRITKQVLDFLSEANGLLLHLFFLHPPLPPLNHHRRRSQRSQNIRTRHPIPPPPLPLQRPNQLPHHRHKRCILLRRLNHPAQPGQFGTDLPQRAVAEDSRAAHGAGAVGVVAGGG
ncbi:hypothetical protein K402DRAFT_219027 [Aulographum hederae CBS 113979]|uniref:Uncharacterized protein n=1 Tax=Aulographum hederae CBS 113979 TaxID=1176131 RepID=A0A6G1GLS8_9PEZI|nr:hypothetical protein K402DRAFT_219027 [Aulographum hederae CBS 113979]